MKDCDQTTPSRGKKKKKKTRCTKSPVLKSILQLFANQAFDTLSPSKRPNLIAQNLEEDVKANEIGKKVN